MTDIFSLNKKVVVITGGTGYLGSIIVKGLIEFGARVVIADVSDKIPDELLNADYTDSLLMIRCDVSDTDSVKGMFKTAAEHFGSVGVLINCATYGHTSPLEKMTDDEWNIGIDGALSSQFRCTREVIPWFEKNGGGVIINFSSMYGMVSPDPSIYGDSGQNNPPNYGAGKAGVLQFTRYCAAHLAAKNIRVNSITPGPFPSPFRLPPEEFMRKLKDKTMLGRVGAPENIVGPVILLASEASSFMTGSNIVVDGGWTAW